MDPEHIAQRAENDLVAEHNRQAVGESAAVGGLVGLVIGLAAMWLARRRRRRRSP